MEALTARRDEMMALVMSGIGLELFTKEGKLLWDVAQIPVFNWNCDHPSYFARRHGSAVLNVHGYVFPDHARSNRDHLTPMARHSGSISAFRSRLLRRPAGDKRNGRIVFAKSDWNPAKLERSWRKTLPPKLLHPVRCDRRRARQKLLRLSRDHLQRGCRHLVYLTPGGDVFDAILTRLDITRGQYVREVGGVLSQYRGLHRRGWEDLRRDASCPFSRRHAVRCVTRKSRDLSWRSLAQSQCRSLRA